jgi:cytochrome c-type biogenesis protein CcmH
LTALWIIFAAMTAAAVFVVLATLARGRTAAVDASEADVAVYRDQLDEIARDRDRGLIGAAEADSARAEVARRLFAATGRDGEPGSRADGATARRRIAAVVALVGVPLIALGGYAAIGQPEMPDMPLAGRASGRVDPANLQDLAARVEAALAKNPNDGRGWAAVAPIYMRLDRPDEAAQAFANAIRLLGTTPEREADRGEALIAAADGVVTADARQALERSVQGEEPSVKGAFYLARGAWQDGDLKGAVARLKALLGKAPADAPYRDAVKDELQRLAEVPAMPMPEATPDVAKKSPEERAAMIRSMVDGLGDRLAAQGGDVGEWLRLVRARAALGDAAKAKADLNAARARFSGDVRAGARLDALAAGLGLEGPGA